MSSRSRGVPVERYEPALDNENDPGSSDYGPDFTSDEEELLNELLRKAGSVTDRAEGDGDGVSAGVTTIAASAPISVATGLPSPEQLGDQKLSSISRLVDVSEVEGDFALLVADIEDQGDVVAGLSASRPTAALAEGLQEVRNNCPVEKPLSPEGRQHERRRDEELALQQVAANKTSDEPDTRSPLERLRRPPRKGLSVTDLVSPSWCELQYWYSLTKFGKKKETPAMRKGSAVHKKLEEQVHIPVPVEITTKEDGWALRIWNVIQGLHTLRTTGMTREMEVWGVVDGEVVTGIIDMLSYDCPDPDRDANGEEHYTAARTTGTLQPQTGVSIDDFLLSTNGCGKKLSHFAVTSENGKQDELEDRSNTVAPEGKRVYITDVKTRGGGGRVPYPSSLTFRPTRLQLHLYYHLLERLITTEETTINAIATRHSLDVNRPFTDTFIAQIAGLNDNTLSDIPASQPSDPDYIPPSSSSPSTTEEKSEAPSGNTDNKNNDTLTLILQHNSLSSLWSLMKLHLRLTFLPDTPHQQQSQRTSLSPLLTAAYFSDSTYPMEHLGSRSFFFDPDNIYPYLSSCMDFWRGRRPARGVALYEAFKCQSCDFRDECEWRKQKEEEYGTAKARQSAS